MKFVEQLKFLDNLSPDIIESLKIYTTSTGYDINKALRALKGGSLNNILKYKNIIENIDSVFDAIPITKSPITLYRDTSLNFNYDIKNYGYVSTTYKRDTLVEEHDDIENPKCCIINLSIPAGVRLIPLFNISNHKEEHEVLLPRNSGMEFISQQIIKGVITKYMVYLPPNNTKISKMNNFDDMYNSQCKKLIDMYEENPNIFDEILDLASSLYEPTYEDFLNEVKMNLADICKHSKYIDGVCDTVFNHIKPKLLIYKKKLK